SARLPGFVRLATTASMPDVPVPEIASVSAPGPVRNTRAGEARIRSSSPTRSGSRWERCGAVRAAATRALAGEGPGRRSRRGATGKGMRPIVHGFGPGRNQRLHSALRPPDPGNARQGRRDAENCHRRAHQMAPAGTPSPPPGPLVDHVSVIRSTRTAIAGPQAPPKRAARLRRCTQHCTVRRTNQATDMKWYFQNCQNLCTNAPAEVAEVSPERRSDHYSVNRETSL